MKTSAPAAPYPTAGSVTGEITGTNPYAFEMKSLTSNQPSSPLNPDPAAQSSTAARRLPTAAPYPSSGRPRLDQRPISDHHASALWISHGRGAVAHPALDRRRAALSRRGD